MPHSKKKKKIAIQFQKLPWFLNFLKTYAWISPTKEQIKTICSQSLVTVPFFLSLEFWIKCLSTEPSIVPSTQQPWHKCIEQTDTLISKWVSHGRAKWINNLKQKFLNTKRYWNDSYKFWPHMIPTSWCSWLHVCIPVFWMWTGPETCLQPTGQGNSDVTPVTTLSYIKLYVATKSLSLTGFEVNSHVGR